LITFVTTLRESSCLLSHTGFLSLVCVVLPLAQISMTSSIYLTVCIAVERYTTVCHPFYKISHKWRSSLYIVPILILSLLYNIPKFFELRVAERENSTLALENVTDFEIKPTDLRLNHLYINVYLIYLNLIVNGLVPFISILVLNICIYLQIVQIQKGNVVSNVRSNQQEIRLSQISVAITGVFILCHSVKWIPNIWELATVLQSGKVDDWPDWVQLISCLSHLLTTFNSSVNFFIYLIKYKQRKHNNQSVTSVDMENITVTTTLV